MNWEKILKDACEYAARKLTEVKKEGSRIIGKSPSGDTTLLADIVAERAIVETLSTEDSISYVSEESGSIWKKDSRYIAVIDPLDGSSNFILGIPFYCISIGIFDNLKKETIAGSVYYPIEDSFYYADSKGVATKNKRRISPSKNTLIQDSVLGIDLSKVRRKELSSLINLILVSKRILHFGANALEMCFVAEGKIDCFIDIRGLLRPTDTFASNLILERSNCIVTNERGSKIKIPLSATKRMKIVASSNEVLHDKIMNYLQMKVNLLS